MAELIKVVIIVLAIALFCGCCFFANGDAVINYLTRSTITSYDRYDIDLIDKTNVDYAKYFLSKEKIDDIAYKLISDDIKDKNQSTNNNDPDDVRNSVMYTAAKNKFLDPNAKIPDLILLDSENKDIWNELPWDKEVSHCDILKDTDRDLYKNVVDSIAITFY